MLSGLLPRATTSRPRAVALLALVTGLLCLAAPADAADAVPPDTFVTMGPAPEITPGPLYFEFRATEPASYRCALDAGPWAVCESPYATTVNAQGPHTLAVVAVDTAGNADPVPAVFSFTILPPTAPAAIVSATAVAGKGRLRVDVDPDWADGSYGLAVQRRRGSAWRTVARARTQGRRDVRTLDLGAGTYRVVIGAANSLSGVTSGPVRLTR